MPSGAALAGFGAALSSLGQNLGKTLDNISARRQDQRQFDASQKLEREREEARKAEAAEEMSMKRKQISIAEFGANTDRKVADTGLKKVELEEQKEGELQRQREQVGKGFDPRNQYDAETRSFIPYQGANLLEKFEAEYQPGDMSANEYTPEEMERITSKERRQFGLKSITDFYSKKSSLLSDADQMELSKAIDANNKILEDGEVDDEEYAQAVENSRALDRIRYGAENRASMFDTTVDPETGMIIDQTYTPEWRQRILGAAPDVGVDVFKSMDTPQSKSNANIAGVAKQHIGVAGAEKREKIKGQFSMQEARLNNETTRRGQDLTYKAKILGLKTAERIAGMSGNAKAVMGEWFKKYGSTGFGTTAFLNLNPDAQRSGYDMAKKLVGAEEDKDNLKNAGIDIDYLDKATESIINEKDAKKKEAMLNDPQYIKQSSALNALVYSVGKGEGVTGGSVSESTPMYELDENGEIVTSGSRKADETLDTELETLTGAPKGTLQGQAKQGRRSGTIKDLQGGGRRRPSPGME